MPKLLLEVNRIVKSFGDQAVLDIQSLRVYDGERVALIGENGAGKSTLLSILSGELTPDSGQVRRYAPLSIIHQSGEERLDAGRQLAARFRAPELRDGLSGGEQTRRRIAAALSSDAPLLLADEPTTDLDADGVERLRLALSQRGGALILVSHDRSLLNALCNRVLHLEDGKLTDFPGGYDEYQRELARRRERQQFEYDQYRAEQARLRAAIQQKAEWASSVKKAPRRMGNSEARLHTREYTNAVLRQSQARRIVQDRMERLEVKERPRDLPQIKMALGASRPISAKTALTAMTEEKIEECRAAGRPTKMTEFAAKRGKVSARTAYEAMRAGDEAAAEVVDVYSQYLACGLTNIVNIFQPEVISIGGGISNEKDALLEPLLPIIRKEQYGGGIVKETRIRIAELGNDAVIDL